MAFTQNLLNEKREPQISISKSNSGQIRYSDVRQNIPFTLFYLYPIIVNFQGMKN